MTTDTASVHAVSEQLDLQRTAVNGPQTPRPENDPGRQPRYHTLISVDDHLVERPGLWIERLPKKWHDMAPHVVEVEGGEQWCFEGVVNGMTGLSAVVGTDLKERGLDPGRFADMRRGCWDAAARVPDMDIDGVQMQLCFPNYSGFAGGRF